MSSAGKERKEQNDPSIEQRGFPTRDHSGPITKHPEDEARGFSARVESGPVRPDRRAALLYELDAPEFQRVDDAAVSGIAPAGGSQRVALDPAQALSESSPEITLEPAAPETDFETGSDAATAPDSDSEALDSSVLLIAQPSVARRSSTRPSTHVPPNEWFDNTLGDLNSGVAGDPRRRLAWRFKACVATYRVLGQMGGPQAREELASFLRNYERELRATAGALPADAKQITDALHAQLSPKALEEQERLLTKVEDKLLAIDETIDDDAFARRFSKRAEKPKLLMRYARLLAVRRFHIGYRRDRFEALAQELLTAQAGSGEMLLMPRVKAALVLRQLLRGLPQPQTTGEDQTAAITYLRDALDRLRSLGGAKQFFESGFFLDVHGYKVSMHDRITSPEFLYLCVALNVEIHNRLRAFAQPSGDGKKALNSWDTLQSELASQRAAVRGVFTNFHIAGTTAQRARPAAKKAQRKAKPVATSSGTVSLARLIVAAVFLLGAVAVNLVELGVVQLTHPPRPLSETELQALTPLLLRGSVDTDHGHFHGLLSRPQWRRLAPRERKELASELASKLHQQHVDHAEFLVYKSRAIEIQYGSVTYVDDAK